VYRDAEWRHGSRVLTEKCYVLADEPRLALDEDGGPALHATLFRSLAGGGATTTASGGGFVTLTVELGVTPEDRAWLRQSLAEQLGLPNVDLHDVPFVDGTVELSFAGEGVTGELTRRLVGNGPATLLPGQRASFLVQVGSDGAALLQQALTSATPLFHVGYDLGFEHALDGITLHVWCDGSRVYELTAALVKDRRVAPGELRDALAGLHAAGCQLTSDTPIAAADEAKLLAQGHALLEDMLARVLFRFDGADGRAGLARDGKVGTLRPPGELGSARFDYLFRDTFAVTSRTSTSTLLSMALDPAMRAERVTYVDLQASDQPLEVRVVCPVDFSDGAVVAVKVTLVAYDQSVELVFVGPGAQLARFGLENGQARSYRYRVSIHFAADDRPLELDWVDTDATLLALPPESLGLLDLRVALGDVALETVGGVTVDVECAAAGVATQLLLDGATPEARWRAVTRSMTPARYRHRATWRTVDGRRIEEPWVESSARRLYLDAPRELRPGGKLLVLAEDDFSRVAQMVVELRATAGAHISELTFTAAGQSRSWATPASGHYQLRTTIAYVDGTRRDGDWQERDATLLIVRDVSRFTVRVLPRLLDLGGTLLMAIVAFEAGGERGAITLTDRATSGAWSFRTPDPARHDYRYTVTLIARDGSRRPQAPRDGAQEILVLHPEE
jgi:hypothetical protein